MAPPIERSHFLKGGASAHPAEVGEDVWQSGDMESSVCVCVEGRFLVILWCYQINPFMSPCRWAFFFSFLFLLLAHSLQTPPAERETATGAT